METQIKRFDIESQTIELVTIDQAIKTLKNYYDLSDDEIKNMLLKENNKFFTPYAVYQINK